MGLTHRPRVCVAQNSRHLPLRRCQVWCPLLGHERSSNRERRTRRASVSIYKKTKRDPEWFEPSFSAPTQKSIGCRVCFLPQRHTDPGEYVCHELCPGILRANLELQLTRSPTLVGSLTRHLCRAKWVDNVWNGLQQSFIYGGAAAVAYSIPTMLGWRTPLRPTYD